MHDYADLSTPTNDWGIALFNEGKYAFDASADRIRMTLHRSPNYPGPAGESWANFERAERLAQDGSKPPEFVGLAPLVADMHIFHIRTGLYLILETIHLMALNVHRKNLMYRFCASSHCHGSNPL